jgi:predicted Fe-Mo cluster-binding NifX family protein
MKIAVATNDGSKVAGHIGRVKSFLKFEIDGKNIVGKELIENSFTHHGRNGENHAHHHGEGMHHGHENLIEGLKDCKALIFNNGGWRIINDLKENNIIPLLTDERDAESAVKKYLDGELVINEENVCQGEHH